MLFFTSIFSKVYSTAEDLIALNVRIWYTSYYNLHCILRGLKPSIFMCQVFFCSLQYCNYSRLTICSSWYFCYKHTELNTTEVCIQLGVPPLILLYSRRSIYEKQNSNQASNWWGTGVCMREEIWLQKTEMCCLHFVQMGITYLVCFKLPLSFQG